MKSSLLNTRRSMMRSKLCWKPISSALLRGPATMASGGRGSHQKLLSTMYICLCHQKSAPEPASGDELHGGPCASSALSEPDERTRAHGTSRHPRDNQEPVLSIGANPGESH